MQLLTLFIASCAVSFAGSLQLGPVNLCVINDALFNTKRAAFFVAIGGSLPEFFYCFLAVYATQFFQETFIFQMLLKMIFILILISVAVVFWMKQSAAVKLKPVSRSTHGDLKNVLKGFSLASFNPQLLPFWIFTLVFFNSTIFLEAKSKAQLFSFILGSGVGAFVFLTFLLMIVNKYKLQLFKYLKHRFYFKVLSVFFFCLAIYQLILLINNL